MAQEGGGSRLDRLLRLLETGSTPAARNEAARQIGELASLHPNQLPNLLRRVSVGEDRFRHPYEHFVVSPRT